MRELSPKFKPSTNYSSKPFEKRLKYSSRRYLSGRKVLSKFRYKYYSKRKGKNSDIQAIDVFSELFVWLIIWGAVTLLIWIIIVILEPSLGGWIFEYIFETFRISRRYFYGSGISIPLIFVLSLVITYIYYRKSDSRIKKLRTKNRR